MTSAQTIAQLDDTQNDDHIEPCASAEAEWDRSRSRAVRLWRGAAAWRWTAESLYRFADGSWLYVIDGGKPQPLTVVPLTARSRYIAGRPVWAHALVDNDDNVIAICDDDIRNATELTHGWGESTR